jgi:C-terminal processing protease CtpA/Prc
MMMNFTVIKFLMIKKLAVLKLEKCINDENYKSMLYKFFMECFEKDVKYIALDLRNNNGGDISVLDEIFKYTTTSKYRTYDIKYRSSKEAKNRGMKNKLFKSKNVKIKHEDGKVYDGELMVLTSYGTKNEANMIAAIFKENNLGKIIGECTGSSPNAYGKNIEFITPNLGMSFSVSSAECITPYKNNLNENTLRPDIYVSSDAKEIVSGSDSTIDWLKNNLF